jgi:c-di-GMP-binding flagellar brake protein YcgR
MFFRRPPRRKPAPEPPGADAPHSNSERITGSAQIARILQRLKDGHCLLRATIPGVTGAFNSAILRVYGKRELLILDELNPHAGHEALLQSGRCNVSCRLHGVEYRFTCVLQRAEEQRGIAYYFVAMPQVLLHIQRRNHYRVPVGSDAGIGLNLPFLDEEQAQASLCDLSASGLGMQFIVPSPPDRGDILPDCSLIMPDDSLIRTKVEVRFVYTRDRLAPTRVGAQFLGLDRKTRDQLATLIKQLERIYLRNQAR